MRYIPIFFFDVTFLGIVSGVSTCCLDTNPLAKYNRNCKVITLEIYQSTIIVF